MPGLVPGIHVLLYAIKKDVDGRVKPGHDEEVSEAQDALLTMRRRKACKVRKLQATWLRLSATYSGSASQMTRLRPLRLAA